MANPMYGQNKFDDSLHNDMYLENKTAFRGWDWSELALRPAADSTDAKTDTGWTMVDGEIAESLWDGAGASAAMILPAASKGALTVLRFAAAADGGADMTITTGSGDFFENATICVPITNHGDGMIGIRRPTYGTKWTQTVATHGGAIVATTSAHNTFIIAATASNNQTAIGAELAFFCNDKGLWRFAFLGSETGSGAINATFATSTV